MTTITENLANLARTFSSGYFMHGGCVLAKSGANLVLSPKNGNGLIINGVPYNVPSAGVTLAAPATSGTTYLIYAYMNAGTMTLEASATAHATDSTTGVEIKSGDTTRTLVGMARTVSSAWVDTTAQRFVESYFNQPTRFTRTTFTVDRSTSSASYVEVNSEIRSEWVSFKTQVAVRCNGSGAASTGNVLFDVGIGIDDATVEVGYMSITQPASSGTNWCNISNETYPTVTEGYHYATVVGRVASGTMSLYSPTSITVTI